MKTVQAMLAEAEAAVPRISPDEAKGLLGRADVLFLDVREPAEVATSGKVPGALAVPRGHIRTSIAARSPSLTRLKQTEVIKIASPGSAQTTGTT